MASCGEATAVDIILASHNPGKRQEFAQIFALYGASQLRLVSPGADAPHVAETGRSYRANARLKAEAFASHYTSAALDTSAALGDDSGLAVDALHGAPGLRTARFGGPGLDEAQRVELLLDRLRGVPPERRGAHFVCALYLAYPDGTGVAAQAYVYGRIADRPAGTHGFGYDPIFLLPHLGCTLAELPPDEKHQLSHRGRAVRHLLRRLGAYGAACGTGNGR
jgi:XTP/dITP diphosphohydrolase